MIPLMTNVCFSTESCRATASFYRRARAQRSRVFHTRVKYVPRRLSFSTTYPSLSGAGREEAAGGERSGDAASSLISTVIVGAREKTREKNLPPKHSGEMTESPLLSRESSFPIRRTTELLVPTKKALGTFLSNVRKNRVSLANEALYAKRTGKG